MTYVGHSYQLLQEEIRLVTLVPAALYRPTALETSKGDTVHCSIHRYPLDGAPPYTALSYTWGSAALRSSIIIDGKVTNITQNLEEALRHLRPKFGEDPLPLWVDDLCIDQHNDAEKSEQVSHMREIYQQATSVTAWLGPAADDSDLAIEWIETFGKRSWELGIGTKPELQLMRLLKTARLGESESSVAAFVEDLRKCLSPANPDRDRCRSALAALFRRPYWSRIWVVQEVAVAASVSFTCGKGQVCEEHLHHALRLCRNFTFFESVGQKVHREDHPEVHNTPKLYSIDPSRPVNLLKIRRAPGSLPLIYLVRSLRQFRATDPRDKIFALLGIASDREVLGITADYSRPCSDVYTDAAYALMKHGWMEVLSLNGSFKNIDGLPSWVPDWTRPAQPGYLQQRALLRSSRPLRSVLQPQYSASEPQEDPNSAIMGSISREDRELVLKTFCIDKVQYVRNSWSDDGIGDWLQDLKALASHSNKAIDPSTIWRCSMADQEIRQANDKPRLRAELLGRLEDIATKHGLSCVNNNLLTRYGLGDSAIQIHAVAQHRRPFLTAEGRLGIGPASLEVDDDVFIIPGANVPYGARRMARNNRYELIGELYIHNVMDGEAMRADMHPISIKLA